MMKKLISTVSLAAFVFCFSTHGSQAIDSESYQETETPVTLAVRPEHLLTSDLWESVFREVVDLTIIREHGTHHQFTRPGIDQQQRNALKRACKFFYSIVNGVPTEYCAIFKKHPVGFLNQFRNLRTLDLSYNKFFTNEEIMTLTHLRSLSLEKNDTITNQGIQFLTNLRSLNLDCNSTINNIGISNMTNLEELYIRSNKKITPEDLSSLTNLKKISFNAFSHNSINQEGLSHLTNLKEIERTY